jgi:hypothetical protein
MTSQIGGAVIYDERDVEIPNLMHSSSRSPSPSKIKYDEKLQKKYGPVIVGLVAIWNEKPSSRAPELDPDVKKMFDKITGYIETIMNALYNNNSDISFDKEAFDKEAFDKEAFQSSITEMLNKLYTFLQQQQRGHSKSNSKGNRRRSKWNRRRSKGNMGGTVRGGMRPSIMNGPGHRAESPAGHQPPPPDDGSIPPSSRSGSSSVSWSQHCIMMILMLSSLFMVYIAYVKFNQTIETVTSTVTVGDLNAILGEIGEAFNQIENGNFLRYILRIFTSSQVDVELYYTSQFTSMIKTMVDRSVKNMADQIKTTCGGDPIFQEGAIKIAGVDVASVANTISNALIGTFNPGKTTECVTNTVIALTRDKFRDIETHLALIVAKILQNQNVIRWLLSGAGVLSIPPLKFYGRIFIANYKEIIKKLQRASPPEEHRGRPGSPMSEPLLALLPPPPPEQGGGRKTRSRRILHNKNSRRVVVSGKRRGRKN